MWARECLHVVVHLAPPSDGAHVRNIKKACLSANLLCAVDDRLRVRCVLVLNGHKVVRKIDLRSGDFSFQHVGRA